MTTIKTQIAFTLFSFLSDTFLVCMYWFILNGDDDSDVYFDERLNLKYAILEVIDTDICSSRDTGINELGLDDSIIDTQRITLVSDLMI